MVRLVILLFLSIAGFYYYNNKDNIDANKNIAMVKDSVGATSKSIGNALEKSDISDVNSDISSMVNGAIDAFNSSSLPDAESLLQTLSDALKQLEGQISHMDAKDKEAIANVLNDLSLRTSVIDSSLLNDNQKVKLASLQKKNMELLKTVKN